MKIVVLPGLNGTADFLDDFRAALPEHDVCICEYDRDSYLYDDIVPTIQLPKVENYIIVAESFSGPIATKLSTSYESNLVGVVYVASFLENPRRVPSWFALALFLVPLRFAPALAIANIFLMGKWANAKFTQEFSRVLAQIPKTTIVKRLQQVQRVGKIIPYEIVPTLYIRPRQDRLVPHRMSNSFSTVESIDGPHFILQARPDAGANIVRSFINNLPQR